MQVRAAWIVLGLATVAGLAWFAAREAPDPARDRERQSRADRAAAQIAEDAVPSLYRWRDANGVLQITEAPPKGRKHERIPRDTAPAVEVRGDRK